MPRQVYGKKGRTKYDPLLAFGSPHSSSPENDHKTPGLDVYPAKQRYPGKSNNSKTQRRALKEKDANSVVQPGSAECASEQHSQKKKPKAFDHDDDQSNGQAEDACPNQPDTAKPQDCVGHSRIMSDLQTGNSLEIDNLPLFVDEDGDEILDDDDQVLRQINQVICRSPSATDTAQSTDGGLSTPSITIQPATPPALDEYSAHCAKLLELSHHSLTEFSEWSDQLSEHFSISKIAEASFGEVYRLSLLEQLPGLTSNDESVFKVIALKPPKISVPVDKRKQEAAKKKLDAMSNPDDVANEVRLLNRMSTIPGFTNFRDVRVVKGRPPAFFARAFTEWNDARKASKKDASHFPDPSKKSSYADDQLWGVIEMQDAGLDLECIIESGTCSSIWSVWDVFWQVTLSLAKGEEGAQFEHRDLHPGNICVHQPATPVAETSVDAKRKLNFTGLETTIIDYTISRALMQDDTVAHQDLSRDNNYLFEGDSTEEYQYDIYRYMRGAVLARKPYAEPPFGLSTKRASELWAEYHPVTNLIWLHFVLYKLLEQTDWPSAVKAPPRRQKEAHAWWKRANDLEHVLLRVQELLDPGVVCEEEGLGSAGQLVGLALEEGWLDVEDVIGEGGEEEEDQPTEERLVQQMQTLALAPGSVDELVDESGKPETPEGPKPRMRRKNA